jgi:succinoglycan biosynthesis transport protein ExoP
VEFTQFISLIRRGWAIVLVATLIGVAAGFALTATTKRSYAATATLFVAAQNSGATADLQQGNAFALSRVKSYADVVTTDLVLTPVTRSLDLKLSREQLVQMITATVVPDTVIVTIDVTSSDPQQAAEIANALSTSLISAAQRIEAPVVQTPVKGTVPKADLSPVKITVVNRASVPTRPANPQTLLKIALGLLVGLALGLIIALIRGSQLSVSSPRPRPGRQQRHTESCAPPSRCDRSDRPAHRCSSSHPSRAKGRRRRRSTSHGRSPRAAKAFY